MKRNISRMIWMSISSLLVLAMLSACGVLNLTIITATPQFAPPGSNTQTVGDLTTTPAASATEFFTPTIAPSPTSTAIPIASKAVTIERIKMNDANTGWAIGQVSNFTSDLILTTQDGGKTWLDVTPAHTFDSIGTDKKSAIGYFTATGNAWVFYYNQDQTPLAAGTAIIWSTADNGQTWTASQPLDLANVQMAFFNPAYLDFVDNQHGWVMAHLDVGMMHDYVTVFSTSDGGQSWTEVVDPSASGDNNLYQSCYKTGGMVFVNANTGWVTGDCGGVLPGVYFYKTTDGGKTWTNQALPAPHGAPNAFSDQNSVCSSLAPQFIDANNGFVGIKCTDLSKTTPVTTTWTYSTTDGGSHWYSTSPALPEPTGPLFFLDDKTGWFLGATSTDSTQAQYAIIQTTDSGTTWKKLTTLSWTGEMDFVSAQVGWVVASDGSSLALVQTTNGGTTWQQLNPVATTTH
jgi:photosystem II stability/assembly factor-like uncharacterized protein